MINKHRVTITLVLICLGLLTANKDAYGFETMSHMNMTRDALKLHAFGESAVKIVQITNFYNDLYEKGNEDKINWLVTDNVQKIIDLAEKLHFDSSSRPYNTFMVQKEWQRMTRVTYSLVKKLGAKKDILGILTVLGASLHVVQDFYSHSNWVEPKSRTRMVEGPASGPGWKEMIRYGSHPTWFDIPKKVRFSRGEIYVMPQPGVKSGFHTRGHGNWKTDDNKSLKNGLNKDSSARPYYTDAYITAYIATRQWVDAVRTWVGNDAVWRAVRRYSGIGKSTLNRELDLGVFKSSWFAGGWDGARGVGEDKLELLGTFVKYGAHVRNATKLHFKWIAAIKKMTDTNPPAVNITIPNSRKYQVGLEFVKFQINYYKALSSFGWKDDPDIYAKVELGGLKQTSFRIRSKKSFRFSYPYRPFTFMKATYKGRKISEPVLFLQLWLKTGTQQGAGTDDSMYLRVNRNTRIKIPGYEDFDDFERGDKRMYRLPVPEGLKVSDIRYLRIEKPKNGKKGEYQLGGMGLVVNSRWLYRNKNINRWLNKRTRSWQARDYTYKRNLTEEVPIKVNLWDYDTRIRGSHDHADINPEKGTKSIAFIYDKVSGKYRGDIKGQGRINVSGSGDSNRLLFRGRLNTIRVNPGQTAAVLTNSFTKISSK
jgi:hypothetical protein